MRFFSDRPDLLTPVTWYFVPRTTPFLGLVTPFVSRVFEVANHEELPLLGEVAERTYYRGNPPAVYAAEHVCGSAAQWLDGCLSTDPVVLDCCGPDLAQLVSCEGGQGYGGECVAVDEIGGVVIDGTGQPVGGVVIDGTAAEGTGGVVIDGTGEAVGGVVIGGTGAVLVPPSTPTCQTTGPTVPPNTVVPIDFFNPNNLWWRVQTHHGDNYTYYLRYYSAAANDITLRVYDNCTGQLLLINVSSGTGWPNHVYKSGIFTNSSSQLSVRITTGDTGIVTGDWYYEVS